MLSLPANKGSITTKESSDQVGPLEDRSEQLEFRRFHKPTEWCLKGVELAS